MAKRRKTRKVTVPVPEELAATLEQWREAGVIPSVSEFVAVQVRAGMDRAASLRRVETVIGDADAPRRAARTWTRSTASRRCWACPR